MPAKLPTWGEIYKEIGGKPIINAMGPVTLLGGSSPGKRVREAMEKANEAYIPMEELQEKAGGLIARMLGVPAAYATSGAASAIVLSAAACMAGDDDDKIQQLPDSTGMRNEFVMQKRQRYWYDRCLQIAGGRIVDAGTDRGTTEAQMLKAIGPKTAGIHYVANEAEKDPTVLSFEQVLNITRSKKVPLIVDAAGQVYPVENMSKYAKAGADLVAYGTKYIGAPHSTGMIVGSKQAVRKAALQSFVSYEARQVRSIGRPHKVDRQEIVGLVAAVREWLTMNHETRLQVMETRSNNVARHLKGIKGVKPTVDPNTIGAEAFGLTVVISPSVSGKSAREVADQLKLGDPPIWTWPGRENDIHISPYGLHDGEDEVVGQRLAAILKK